MDEPLKQRLVGAAVIVIVGVAFIPFILPGPPTTRSESTQAPVALNPSPGATFSSAIVPAEQRDATRARRYDTGSKQGGNDVPSGKRALPSDHLSAHPSGTEPKSVSANAKEGAERPRAQARPRPNVRAEPVRGWAVQLGAFSEAKNALALRERLKARGYKAFAETLVQDDRRVTRVLVGPMSGRLKAQGELEQLRAATSLSGILVRYPKE